MAETCGVSTNLWPRASCLILISFSVSSFLSARSLFLLHFSPTHFKSLPSLSLSSDTFCAPSLLCQDTHTHTHGGGEVGRLVLACHLSSALTLALITASPLANAASLGRRSMCSRHKHGREVCTRKTRARAIMRSGNLSGAKGNSHQRLNAHFAFLSPSLLRSSSLCRALPPPRLLVSSSPLESESGFRGRAPKQRSPGGVLLPRELSLYQDV